MKYLTIALVSTLLFVTVACNASSTLNKSIKERIIEKIPGASRINSTLNGVGTHMTNAKGFVAQKTKDIAMISVAVATAPFLLTTVIGADLMAPFIMMAYIYLMSISGAIFDTFVETKDYTSALIHGIRETDFADVWEEHYHKDLMAGLERITACKDEPNKSKSAKCIAQEASDLVQKFLGNLKEHNKEIYEKAREYSKEYDGRFEHLFLKLANLFS